MSNWKIEDLCDKKKKKNISWWNKTDTTWIRDNYIMPTSHFTRESFFYFCQREREKNNSKAHKLSYSSLCIDENSLKCLTAFPSFKNIRSYRRDLPVVPGPPPVLAWTLVMLFRLDSRELLMQSLTDTSFVAVGIQIRYVVLAWPNSGL